MNNYTEILLYDNTIEEIPLSYVRGELIIEFAGYNTLLENFLDSLNN